MLNFHCTKNANFVPPFLPFSIKKTQKHRKAKTVLTGKKKGIHNHHKMALFLSRQSLKDLSFFKLVFEQTSTQFSHYLRRHHRQEPKV